MARKRRHWRAGLVVSGLVACFLAATPGVALGKSASVKVIVNFRDVPGLQATTVRQKQVIKAARGSLGQRFRLIDSVAATVPADQLAALRRNPNVRSVELDHPLRVLDHGANSGDAELEASWGVEHIGAGDVHNAGNTGQGVKVGVIDTGIDYTHPDLDAVYAGGYDFFNNDADPFDDNGHGTHVAGILAAERNSPPAGVVGVAPSARIYAYKVLGANGSGDYSGLIAALERASLVDHVAVVNISLGGSEASDALAAAVAAAYAQGTILVAASGNVDPSNFQQLLFGCPVVYPASYPEVFATTFTGQNNQLTGFSCTGPQVDFASPGDLIKSTVPTGLCTYCAPSGYRGDLSGTSMASPHLAGTVALVLAHGITNSGDQATLADDVKAHLCATTSPGFGVNSTPIPQTDARYPKYFGCGVVDANKALLTNPPPTDGPPPPPPDNQQPVASDDAASTEQETAVTVDVLANDSDPDGDALTVSTVGDPSHGTAAVNAGAVRYTPGAGYSGPDSFNYTISDGHGGSATAVVTVTVAAAPPPPPNQPPVAVDDSATAAQDTAVDVNVLANDSDPDGDTLTVSSVSAPVNGSAVINGAAVRYTPAAGFAGSDSFSYTVDDGHGGSAAASVSVTVTPSPSVHVEDIDAFTSRNSSNWSIRIRVYAYSQAEKLLQNVGVRGSWNTGLAQSCTTNRFGYCEMSLVAISLSVPSRTYTITSLTASGRTYLASANHDPDPDSNGTLIVVPRP